MDWYIKQQVHPPVARLLEPVKGTDSVQLGDALGLKINSGGGSGGGYAGGDGAYAAGGGGAFFGGDDMDSQEARDRAMNMILDENNKFKNSPPQMTFISPFDGSEHTVGEWLRVSESELKVVAPTKVGTHSKKY